LASNTKKGNKGPEYPMMPLKKGHKIKMGKIINTKR
jgi:hypothetical protein